MRHSETIGVLTDSNLHKVLQMKFPITENEFDDNVFKHVMPPTEKELKCIEFIYYYFNNKNPDKIEIEVPIKPNILNHLFPSRFPVINKTILIDDEIPPFDSEEIVVSKIKFFSQLWLMHGSPYYDHFYSRDSGNTEDCIREWIRILYSNDGFFISDFINSGHRKVANQRQSLREKGIHQSINYGVKDVLIFIDDTLGEYKP